jgi:hypothetical protein
MPTINITRTSAYMNRLRDYQLYLDGKKIGTIGNGQTKQLETTAGQHTLLAKIDWCSSETVSFTLSESETQNLRVDGFKHAHWMMPVAMGAIALHFVVNLFFDFYYTIFLVIPAFLLLLYYMTIGRKSYLQLKEAN